MSSKKYSLKVVLIVISALLSPFIYPIALRLLIKINIFHSVNEYILYTSTFSNKYTIISTITVISIVFFCFIDKFPNLREFLSNFRYTIKKGDSEVNVNPVDKKIAKDVFVDETSDAIEESNEIKSTINNALKNKNKKNKSNDEQINEEKINELTNIIKNIKFFSAYNNTNFISKELLLKLLENEKMPKKEFEEELKRYYDTKIKNVYGEKKKKCVNKNIEDKIFNYVYLDILELSDYGDEIILTNFGREFVEKYMKEEGVG